MSKLRNVSKSKTCREHMTLEIFDHQHTTHTYALSGWDPHGMYSKPFAENTSMVHVTHTLVRIGSSHVGATMGRETCILLVMYIPTISDCIYNPPGFIDVPGFSATFLFMMIIHNIYWLTLFATTTTALAGAVAAADHYKTRQVGAANTPEYSIYYGKSCTCIINQMIGYVLINLYPQRMKMAYLSLLSMICHFALTPIMHPYTTWLSRSLDGIMQS